MLTPEMKQALTILQDNNGKHTNNIIHHIQNELHCGPTKAGNLLKALVKEGYAEIKEFRIYTQKR